MQKNIVVIGAGAVGGYFGGHLTRVGIPVTLIDPWPAHVEAMRRDGLTLSGMTAAESATVAVRALHLTEVQGLSKGQPVDIAICATKSYDTAWATTMIAPYLAPDGFVVSAQNSINEDVIAGIVGWGRTVGCVAGNNFGVDLTAPGQIKRTMARDFTVPSLMVGEAHGRVTPRAEALCAMLAQIDGAKVTTNLWGERWSKLCVNGMRNGVSAATGLGGNARDSHPVIRRVVIRPAGEAIRTGQACGYALSPITGIEPGLLLAAADGDAAAMDQVERRMGEGSAGAARSDAQRPSMAQDIMKGRRTEIDFINGLIARRAREAGLAAPTHERLIAVVRRIERGELDARPENVFDL